MVELPKPDWLSLSAALSEIVAMGIEEEQARSVLHQLMQDSKVVTRARCKQYFENESLNIIRMNQVVNIWTEIPIADFDFHNSVVRKKTGRNNPIAHTTIVSDISVYRTSLLACFESKAPILQATKVKNAANQRQRSGPAHKQTDDQMWAEMARRAVMAEWEESTTQALASKQMLDWLEDNEIQLSESTVRNRVRALWSALSWRDKG